MSRLLQFIRQEIETRGPISFARFMDLALYHPELGYYERSTPQTGPGGDFFTSVNVGPVFGELLAFRFARWLSVLGEGPLHVMEAGAHDGRLAADILGFLRAYEPALADRTEYWVLEPSGRRRDRQFEGLRSFTGRVQWAGDWNELPGLRGVVFSNELLDALPVHRLCWRASERTWTETGVGWGTDELVWTTLPGDAGHLAPALPRELLAAVPDGYTIEVGAAALEWWRRAASALRCGWLLTLDYGDAPGESVQPGRSGGTLRAYRKHRASSEVLADPGEQDLTAHVDFGAIQVAGESAGLRTEGFWSQEAFLAGILGEIESGCHRFPPWTPARLRQCKTLIHPAHFGASFKVLAQRRDPH